MKYFLGGAALMFIFFCIAGIMWANTHFSLSVITILIGFLSGGYFMGKAEYE